MSPAIIVHGGAGPIAADDVEDEAIAGCLRAARTGHEVLRAGASALDAVVAAVCVLEDDPLFNAGIGSALNEEGEVEADASVMRGEDLAAGAVAVVKGVKNPVLLAKAVMERTQHVLLAGEGAIRLAREAGIERVEAASLVTERARRRLERAKLFAAKGSGTVGAVAVDGRGRVAAATSTGGTANKRVGRVGDTPLLGCGTYADDRSGAVSCTGHGEAIMRVVLAKSCADRLAGGLEPFAAAASALAELDRIGGEGGLICADRLGRLGFAFNTERMARAWIDSAGREGAGFGRVD